MYVEEIARLKQYLNASLQENEQLKNSQEANDEKHYEDALANKKPKEQQDSQKELNLKTQVVAALQRKLR